MRDHGTRACYVFGPQPGSDRANGCRCEPCTEANREYARARDRRARRPDETVEPAYIDATEVRQHIAWLRTQGIGTRTICQRAGVSRSALVHLASGTRRRCTPALAGRVLAVGRSATSDGAYIDATATWRLIDDLIAHGHTRTALARLLGSTAKVPALQIGRRQVRADTARRVADLHQRLMLPVLVDRANAAERRARYRAREAAA